MFIKIVDKNSGYTRESTFECARYSTWNMEQNTSDCSPKIMLEIRGPNIELDYEIFKNMDTEVYVMNEDGKTIDRMGPW